MYLQVEQVQILLILAIMVAVLARRVRLSYSVGLLLAGLAFGSLPIARGYTLSRDLLFFTLLPPLIFDAAINIHWADMRRDLGVLCSMAGFGVLISAAVIGFGLSVLVPWGLGPALVFGVLISATDPVAVIAIMRESGIAGRLRLLLEAESLLNDGVAAVAFTIGVSIVMGGSFTLLTILGTAAVSIAGGIAAGLLVSGCAMLVAGRTDEHLVEIALSTVAAYGSFLLAEEFHCSGILATLTAGLVLANTGHIGSFSDKGRGALEAFWEFAAFVANSIVFLLMGIRGSELLSSTSFLPAAAAILLSLAGRGAGVVGSALPFWKSRQKIPWQSQGLLVWGGLRGALAMALALTLPPGFPHRDDIVVVAFAVVAFSVIVQGITIAPIMRRLAG